MSFILYSMTDFAITSASLTPRLALITALPCFSMLSLQESQELAVLMSEEKYPADSTIVVEDELIDKVYIIVKGQAEVSRQTIKKRGFKKKASRVLLAILNPGESIGLNDTGFFSTTGKRTASVIALTDVEMLTLDLKSLHQFLKQHPHLQNAMYATVSQLLRVRLIKQSLPFVKLSHDRIHWLAEKVEEMSVASGSVIFKQGEQGSRCYLIRTGRVEIFVIENDGSERRLAILKSPTLFGEATMITRDPRNATARALENCELLVLDHQHLSELMETEENVASMFMTLMINRSRPMQNPHVSSHQRITADGQEIVILKNPDSGKYFKLSKEGWFIWQQLNGEKTMQAITMALANELNTFAPDVVAALISKLAKSGFVQHVEIKNDDQKQGKSFFARYFEPIRRLLEIRYAFGDADKWVTNVYNKLAHFLFTRIGKIVLTIIAVSGFAAFLYMTNDTIESFKLMPHIWWLFVALVPATVISVALHELGHAFATKSFGYEVHYMGVGWYWMSPVAFTDTSDMWLSSRGPRTVVNLAGVFTDTLVAGSCALLVLFIDNPYIDAFLWLFALYTYINAFRMLSPLQELDGYYALMDLLDKPHLREASVKWLITGFPKALRHPSLFKKNMPEVWYWVSCLVFLILISALTLFVQSFVLNIIGIHANPYLGLSLPILVAIISSVGIISDIKNKAEE